MRISGSRKGRWIAAAAVAGAIGAGLTAPVSAPEMTSRPPVGLPVNNGYPALARASNGALWLAWASMRNPDLRKRGETRDQRKTDYIMLKRRPPGGAWSQEVRVSDEPILHSDPALAPDASGVWVIWSTRRGREFDLAARHVSDNLELGPAVALVTAEGADAAPRAAVAPDRTIHVIWEGWRGGWNRIHHLTGKDGRWSQAEPISPDGSNAYRPAIAVDGEGVPSIAWDGGGEDRYRVYL